MAIILCSNNHVYDDSKYDSCPYCVKLPEVITCPRCKRSYDPRLFNADPSDNSCPFCRDDVTCTECGYVYKQTIYNSCPRCEMLKTHYICPKCKMYYEKKLKEPDSELCPDCIFLEQQVFCEHCGSLYDKSKYQVCPYCSGAEKPDIIKRDEQGNLYADFDLRILMLTDLRQCKCGHFMKKDTKYCAGCGKPFAGSLLNYMVNFDDPVEKTEEYHRAIMKVKEKIEAEFPPNQPVYIGKVHDVWHRQQQILLEEYHIRWRTPAEMHPGICFD